MTNFRIRNLSVLSYAAGFTAWHYRASAPTLTFDLLPPLPLAEILADGFFADAADLLSPGDTITVSASDGCAILYVTSTHPTPTLTVVART